MEEKTEKGQQIGQLPKRDVLTGNEQFPFQEDRENGSITPNVLKSFISSGKGGYMSYITEYNVSIHHPSSGIDSGNKYTLEGAIVQVPEDIRMVGLKVSFLNNSGLVETWEFAGGVFENIENWKSNEDKLTDIRDEAIDKIKDAESDAISNFSSQRVTPDMLSESTKQFINASGGGTINNLADDEDLVSVDKGESLSVLKFADRAYNPDRFSGKGYKILRRNIIDGKNILTQEMINQPDTIYEIRYDFDLDGAEISIPEGCILKFNGGQIAMGADQAQTLKAIREAEAYPGPSLIIAYAPCINHGLKLGMGKSQAEEEKAVKCGYWHLWRYNPALEAEGKNPFQLDSKEPDWAGFQDFLKSEVRYSSVMKQYPSEAAELFQAAEDNAKWRYNSYKRLSKGNWGADAE